MIAGIALVMVGCQSLISGDDVAARITNPTDHSRAALQNTINEVLNTRVALADDALTDSGRHPSLDQKRVVWSSCPPTAQ